MPASSTTSSLPGRMTSSASHATEHALAQRLDDIAAFDERRHEQAVGGAAVQSVTDQILGHVHQAPGEVAGVGGLERGIRQTLAGTVGRDEVLQDVEAFAEVRRDRRLDDGAVRLRHQAAHAGELPDLGGGTAGAGVGHHEDRIERGLLDASWPSASTTDLGAQLLHHRLGDLVVGARPDVDDLVVALAIGHQTARRTGPGSPSPPSRRPRGCGLLLGNDHVVHADRDPGAGGIVRSPCTSAGRRRRRSSSGPRCR